MCEQTEIILGDCSDEFFRKFRRLEERIQSAENNKCLLRFEGI